MIIRAVMVVLKMGFSRIIVGVDGVHHFTRLTSSGDRYLMG